MPSTTQLFQMLPWVGGVNTSIDESLIQPNQLTVADNVVFDTRGSRKKREGINHNWDSASATSVSIVGLHDFWFGSSTRTQRTIGVSSTGVIYSYASGTRTTITDPGTAWSGTITNCSMATYGNRVFIGVNGITNVVKVWDGTTLSDLCASYNVPTVSRASSGTTRTIVFRSAFPAQVGDTIVVAAMGNASYNGTFTVATKATTSVANDTITFTGSGSLTESTTTDTTGAVGQPGPLGSALRVHQGRLVMNDKVNPDRIHYCQVGNYNYWLGYGDSGAIDIGVGDGDPKGVTAIFPPFKGDLFIAKRTKLYRVSGPSPDMMSIELVSDGIGCESHNSAVAVDQDDLFWVSFKGVHSLAATADYGDFSSSFVSGDIQKTFNEGFDLSRLPFVWGAYLPQLNSIAFTFTETTATARTLTVTTVNNALWLYNIPTKAWYRWADLPCQSLVASNDSDKKRPYFGTHTGRVSRGLNGTLYDISAAGTNTAIRFRVVTGQIFPDGNPFTVKGLKRLVLYYRPKGSHTIVANVTVDNFTLDTNNSISFSAVTSAALLGSTLTLGSSLLGYEVVLGPYSGSVDGYGRGCKIEIIQSGINEEAEIQGFALEYESAGSSPEVVLRQ